MPEVVPLLYSVALDTTDARGLAEFYRQLLGYGYRPGDEPPPEGEPDVKGEDWLVLVDGEGRRRLAFQRVDHLPASTWPEDGVAQQLHLDFAVSSAEELVAVRDHALGLGAQLRDDRFEHPVEPLYVFADPAGHPFCVFVVDPADRLPS